MPRRCSKTEGKNKGSMSSQKWIIHRSHGSSAISWLHKMQRRSHFEEGSPRFFHYMCAHNRFSYLKHLSVVMTNQIWDHLPLSSIHLIHNEQCDNDEAVIMLFLIVPKGWEDQVEDGTMIRGGLGHYTLALVQQVGKTRTQNQGINLKGCLYFIGKGNLKISFSK